jgi:hypothetical protein
MRLGSFIACAAVAPLLMGASQPVRLVPSSQWIVDYAENSCRLLRTFGEGNSKVIMLLESESPGDMDLVLTGKPLKSERDEIVLKFLPHQEPVTKGHPVTASGLPAILASQLVLVPPDEAARMAAERAEQIAKPNVRPPATDPAEDLRRRTKAAEFVETATEMEIDTRPGKPVILETGELGKPMKAFDECSRDSLRDWGVDPELQDKIVKPVWLANNGHWISADDYPRKMLDEGQQSEVKVRLLVDASGHVTKCTSLSHFRLPEFKTLVCDKITSKARFLPAELADGTKVPSYYTVHIVFRIAQ